MNAIQKFLRDLYLEYANDYLTIAFMARSKDIPEDLLRSMVEHGRTIDSESVSEEKKKQ